MPRREKRPAAAPPETPGTGFSGHVGEQATGKAPGAVIWDMDGVLVDSARLHFRSWRAAFRSYGVGYTWEDFKGRFGQKNEVAIRYVLGEDVKIEVIEDIAARKEKHFRQLVEQGEIETFPGVVTLVRALYRAGFSLALASSAPRLNIELIVRRLRLSRCFPVIISAEDVVTGKPEPGVFLLAAERLNVPPERCVVIEDAVAGVEAARRAEMKCIAVTNTNPAGSLGAADLVVDSLKKVTVETVRSLIES